MRKPEKYIQGLVKIAVKKEGAKSVTDLAAKLGIKQPSMSRYARGVAVPTGSNAVALAKAVGINPDAFLIWSAAKMMQPRLPDEAQYVFSFIKKNWKKGDLVPPRSGLDPWA